MNILIDVSEDVVARFDALREAKLAQFPKGRPVTADELNEARKIAESGKMRDANAFLKSICRPATGRKPSRRGLLVEALRIGLDELEARQPKPQEK